MSTECVSLATKIFQKKKKERKVRISIVLPTIIPKTLQNIIILSFDRFSSAVKKCVTFLQKKINFHEKREVDNDTLIMSPKSVDTLLGIVMYQVSCVHIVIQVRSAQ